MERNENDGFKSAAYAAHEALEQGDFGAALAAFDSVEIKTFNDILGQAKAALYNEAEPVDGISKALQILNVLSPEDDSTGLVAYNLGNLRLRRYKLTEHLDDLLASIRLSNTALEKGLARKQVYINIGTAHSLLKNHAVARDFFQLANLRQQADPASDQPDLDVLNGLTLANFRLSKLQTARENAKALLELLKSYKSHLPKHGHAKESFDDALSTVLQVLQDTGGGDEVRQAKQLRRAV